MDGCVVKSKLPSQFTNKIPVIVFGHGLGRVAVQNKRGRRGFNLNSIFDFEIFRRVALENALECSVEHSCRNMFLSHAHRFLDSLKEFSQSFSLLRR